MTSAPVPLAEQITWARKQLDRWVEMNDQHPLCPTQDDPNARRRDIMHAHIDMYRSVLATLQQHERAMAALREPNKDIFNAAIVKAELAWHSQELYGAPHYEKMAAAVRAALLAAIDAANTAGDAVTTEEER